MSLTDEILVYARMMVTPTNQIANRKAYMSEATQRAFEEMREAFGRFVDGARQDVIAERERLETLRETTEADTVQDGNE